MSTPLLLLAIVGAVVIVGVTVMFYLKARYREAVDAPELRNVASTAAPVAIADEVRAIGEQIDRAMSEQRLQGETQRQLLAQKLDSVRQTIDQQRTHVEGLRSEMRHESKRRDVEMDEIRAQIGTLHQAVGLPAAAQAALPAAEAAPPAEASSPGAAPFTPPTSAQPSAAPPYAPAAPEPPVAQPPAVETFSAPEPIGAPALEASMPLQHQAPAQETFSTPNAASQPPEEQLSAEVPRVKPQPLDSGMFGEASFDAPAPGPAPEAATPEPSAFQPMSFEDVAFDPLPSTPADGFAEVDAPEADPAEADLPEAADPFGEIAFGSDSAPPAGTDAPTFADVSFSAPAPQPADAFGQPDTREPVGGDSVAAEPSMFESWAPSPPDSPAAQDAPPEPALDAPAPFGSDTFAPVSFSEVAPTADLPVAEPDDAPQTIDASEFATSAPQQSPEPAAPPQAAPSAEGAWITRLDRAPEADSVPSTGLVDLDALAGAQEPDQAPAPAAPPAQLTFEAAAPPQLASSAPDVPPTAPEADDAAVPAEDTPQPVPVPEGAEDLTVISSIDEDTQRLLYQEGVITLEEIAQWGRGDARRVGVAVQVSEDTIMNTWVFEAQAALFSRYAEQAGG